MTPAELLAALKEAPGPSAELNVRIWALINGYQIAFVEQASAYRAYKGDDAIWVAAGNLDGDMEWREHIGLNAKFPNFTGSLDATKAAIKDKWPECKLLLWEVDPEGPTSAIIFEKQQLNQRGATLELALCAALVAALMEEGK